MKAFSHRRTDRCRRLRLGRQCPAAVAEQLHREPGRVLRRHLCALHQGAVHADPVDRPARQLHLRPGGLRLRDRERLVDGSGPMRRSHSGQERPPDLHDLDLLEPVQRHERRAPLRQRQYDLGPVLRRALRGRRAQRQGRQGLGDVHLPIEREPDADLGRRLQYGGMRVDLVGGDARGLRLRQPALRRLHAAT